MDREKTRKEQSNLLKDWERELGAQEKHADGQLSSTKTEEAAMCVKNLNMYYGSFKALTDVNIEIRRYRITALIGPSGCGKSTFIRGLNRMHEVIRGARVEGSVRLDGEDIYAENVDPMRVRRKDGLPEAQPLPNN